MSTENEQTTAAEETKPATEETTETKSDAPAAEETKSE